MGIADIGGKEFDIAPAGLVAEIGDQRRRYIGVGRRGDCRWFDDGESGIACWGGQRSVNHDLLPSLLQQQPIKKSVSIKTRLTIDLDQRLRRGRLEKDRRDANDAITVAHEPALKFRPVIQPGERHAAPIDGGDPRGSFAAVFWVTKQLDQTDDAGGDFGAVFWRQRVERLECARSSSAAETLVWRAR
jgi:hypothetical protein